MSYLLAFVGFSLLIILHEFGHFIVAKATGMRVERFALFFPPLLVKVKRGETEYGIGAIPLGGFVKITGMNPDEKLPPEIARRGYYAQPVWKRVVVILAGPAMNLLIAFLLLFALAFGALKLAPVVHDVTKGSPAEATLERGDRIISVDGKRGDPNDVEAQLATFRRAISSHRCAGRPVDGCVATTPARLQVERNGRVVTVFVRPRYDSLAKRTVIGFQFGEPVHPSVPEAARVSVNLMWFVTRETVSAIGRIFQKKQREQISSFVGGYEVTRQGFAEDTRRALTLLAVISLSLAIINLFPFLPLDGGHVFWSLVEKVRGRRVPFSVMERASAVGFVLIIMLFLIGFSNDVDRLTGGGFQQR